MADDAADVARLARDYQVHVLGQDRASVEDVFRFAARLFKSERDGACLHAVERDGRIIERLLGGQSQLTIVCCFGDRATSLGFGCGTENAELVAANVIRPGAARVVWQPETVGCEDDVVCQCGIVAAHDGDRIPRGGFDAIS